MNKEEFKKQENLNELILCFKYANELLKNRSLLNLNGEEACMLEEIKTISRKKSMINLKSVLSND